MKKIFFLLAGVLTFFACDPTHEDIGNDGHISLDDLIAKTTVTVDQDGTGKNGNVITCNTSAPVAATWTFFDKVFNEISFDIIIFLKKGCEILIIPEFINSIDIEFSVKLSFIHVSNTVPLCYNC